MKELFDKNDKYYIPDYQRSYSWAESQLEQWLKDLQEIANIRDSQYYLGRILLEKDETRFAIIDGQQRLNTLLLFFVSAVQSRKKSSIPTRKQLREYCNQFELGGTDNDFFQKLIQHKAAPIAKTKSQEKLLYARQYFLKKFKDEKFSDKKLSELCKILLESAILIQKIADKRMATLIFQLENDRGVNLTNLEKLKSYLMYELLLQSSNEGLRKDEQNEKLKEVSHIFNKIGNISFNIKENPNKILEAHYRSFITPEVNPFRKYTIEKMQDYIRNKKMPNDDIKITDRIIWFCENLLKSFQAVDKLENKRDDVFQNTLKYLDIPSYVWPFLLVEFKRNSFSNAERLKKLLIIIGNIVLRQEMVSYFNSDRVSNITKKEYLGVILHAFRKEEQDIKKLEKSLIEGFEKEWKVKGYSKKSIKKALIWSKDKYNNYLKRDENRGYYSTRLVKFFLMQYERELGSDINPKLDWTIEHISPQSKRAINDAADYGNDKEAIELVDDDWVGWIGNLCLLERNLNSRASNKPFKKKIEVYKKSTLAQAKEVRNYASQDHTYWDIAAIKKRGNILINFIKKYKQNGSTNSFTIF